MATNDKAVTILGSKESIDFPDLGLFEVPAKVDTGADTSAVWASDIQERDGTLHYTLFDRMSPFYTGEVLSTQKFSVASIKNSFGHTEFRYKVTQKIRLGGHLIRVRFTLANRENNRWPILIGRRTLHGKFLVDVAHAEDKGPQRLLLVSSTKTDSIRDFIRSVEKGSEGKIDITYISYDDVQFMFNGRTTKIVITETGEDIASFDIVHFKTWKERDVTAAMASYLQKRGVKFFDKRAAHFSGNSKLFQYVVLSDNGIVVPPSLFVMPERYPDMFGTFKDSLGLPFVFKGIHASRGAHNYLVKDRTSYDEAVKAMSKDEIVAIAQQFVANDGDYRVLVLGHRLALIIYRSRKDDTTHLNNTSQGGGAKLVLPEELPTNIRNDSITAAALLELGIAGVDMLQDKEDGSWYCLEVNGDPQIATGAFVNEKHIAYVEYIETELSK